MLATRPSRSRLVKLIGLKKSLPWRGFACLCVPARRQVVSLLAITKIEQKRMFFKGLKYLLNFLKEMMKILEKRKEVDYLWNKDVNMLDSERDVERIF